MPNLSNRNQQSIRALTEASNALPWYSRWLFPSQLKAALVAHQITTDEIKSAWIICDCFLNNTWFFQRWIFSCLRNFYESPLIQACRKISFLDGLVGTKETKEKHDSFDIVAKSENPSEVDGIPLLINAVGLFDGKDDREAMQGSIHPTSVAHILCLLKKHTTLLTGTMAQANREAIARHADPYLDNAVNDLIGAKLLTGPEAQANLDAILTVTKPSSLARLLIMINRKGLLTPAILNALTRHEEIDDLYAAFFFSNTENILSGDGAQANLDAVLYAQPGKHRTVMMALTALELAGLLSGDSAQANREAILRHPNPGEVARALDHLRNAGLTLGECAQINFNTVIQHQSEPDAVARSLVKLNMAGLLTRDIDGQSIRNIVATHQAPENAATTIICLNESNPTQGSNGLLTYAQRKITQTNTNVFFQPSVVVQTEMNELRTTVPTDHKINDNIGY